MTLLATETNPPPVSAPERVTRPEATGWIWAWMVVATSLMLVSAAVRFWQDRQFQAAREQAQASKASFPLKEVPEELGRWKTRPGAAALPEDISRVAGALDSEVRTYVDKETGVVLDVLLLFGHAEQVNGHSPEVCYGGQGYNVADVLESFKAATNLVGPQWACRFRSLLLNKEGGSEEERLEVLYTFRHNGVWAPEIKGRWKELQTSSPVLKLMIQRRVGGQERRGVHGPSEEFLNEIIPAIEQVASESRIPAARN